MSGKDKLNNKSSGIGDLLKLKKRNAIVSAAETKPSISNSGLQQITINTIGTDAISLVLWQKGLNIAQAGGSSGVNPIIQLVSKFLTSNSGSILPIRSTASRTFFTALDTLLSNQSVSAAVNINTPNVSAYYNSLFSSFITSTPIAPSTGFYALSSTNVNGVQTISQSAIRSVPSGGFMLIPSSYPVAIGNYLYTVNSTTNQISYTDLTVTPNVTTGPLTLGSLIPLSFPGSANTPFTFIGSGSSGVIVSASYKFNPDVVNTYKSGRTLHRAFVSGNGENIFAAYTSGNNYYITNIVGTPSDLVTGTGTLNINHLVSSSNGLRVYAIGSSKSGGVITNTFISNLVTPPTLSNLDYRSLCTDSTGSNMYVCAADNFIYKAIVTYNPDDIRQAYSTPFTKLSFNPVTFGGRFGTTIRSTDFPLIWTSIACSSDGTYVIACASANYLYLSKDSGSTWLPVLVEGSNTVYDWRSVSMSGDGRIIFAVSNTKIFISQDFGSSFRSVGPVGFVDGVTTSWNFGKVTSDGSQIFVTRSPGRHYILTLDVANFNWTYFVTNGGEDDWTSLSITNDKNKFLLTNGTQDIRQVDNTGYVLSSDGTTLLGTYGSLKTWLPFPAGITSIASNAFYDYSSVTGSITIPNTVTSIGKHAFLFCSGMTGNLVIPSGVTVGEYAFRGCSGLTGLTLSPGVVDIQVGAFFACTGFTGSLVIPNSITSISEKAFSSTRSFTSLTLPNGLTVIGVSAFAGCSGMVGALNIPNTVHTIKYAAFAYTSFTSLSYNTDLSITSGTIEDWAFHGVFVGSSQQQQYIDLDYDHYVHPGAFHPIVTIYRYRFPDFQMYAHDDVLDTISLQQTPSGRLPTLFQHDDFIYTPSNVGTVAILRDEATAKWERYPNATFTYKGSSNKALQIVNIVRQWTPGTNSLGSAYIIQKNHSFNNNNITIPAVTDMDLSNKNMRAGCGRFYQEFPNSTIALYSGSERFRKGLSLDPTDSQGNRKFIAYNQTYMLTLKIFNGSTLLATRNKTFTTPNNPNSGGYSEYQEGGSLISCDVT